MFIGGTYRTEEMRLGQLVPKIRIPAKRVPDAVERVIDLYHADRDGDQELFSDWIDRAGLSPIQETLNDLTLPPEFSPDTLPMFIDWDRQDIYILQRGEGECAV